MIYELATLDLRLDGIPDALPALEEYTAGAGGRLLGCWQHEHGVVVGRFSVLRGFADAGELAAERERVLHSADPFGVGKHLDAFEVESYAPFDFLPDVEPGEFGSVYEIRVYHLKIGGLAPTIEGWRAAVPARVERYPLTVAMYALDGRPRIAHVWPFPSMDERLRIRAGTFRDGIWPPPHGPENIAHATSTIALPTAISPLR